MKHVRAPWTFSSLLLAMALMGCAATVDDDEVTSSSSDALSVAVADGEAAPVTSSNAYSEFVAVIEQRELSIDATSTDLAAGSTCRNVCACCRRNGNRFCCSHCRFCSGPIGATDVLER